MMLKKDIVIAVDGFSSCGKSTFAKQIAADLDYLFIDTGAMYRAVSLFALENNLADKSGIQSAKLIDVLGDIKIHFERKDDGKLYTFLNNKNVEDAIRGIEVSELVSEVSKIKEVRQFLVTLQQEMGKKKRVVMDGRDIGTVVFSEAEIKLFMTASPDVRAQRRFDELKAKGMDVSYNEIKKNIEERDWNDVNRKESPLKQAADANVLDNSNMTVEQQFMWFEALLKEKKLILLD